MNVHARSVRPAALLVVSLLAAGVSGCDRTTPTGPLGAPTPAGTPPDLELSAGVVPAGRYRLRGFDPSITIELDGSWQSLAQQVSFTSITQIQRPPGSNPYAAGTIVQIAHVDAVGSDQDRIVNPTSAAGAVEAVRRSVGDMFEDSAAISIGGLNGTQVTVGRPGDGPAMSRDVVEVMSIPAGNTVLSPGTRLWIAFVEERDGVVAIIVNSSSRNWDRELAAALPVLNSLIFEPPSFQP